MRPPACFLVMNSVHEVMKAEKELIKRGISLTIIATPREISHNCGVAISFSCGDINAVREAMRDAESMESSGLRLFRRMGDAMEEVRD